MRCIINPKFKKYKPFINGLVENFEFKGDTIYQGRNIIKTFQMEDGIVLNVKSFKIPHLINKIAYAWLRGSKAKHSYKYGLEILNRGVNTPEPVAVVERLKNGFFYKSYYVSVHHVNDFTIRDLIGFDFPDKENILEQFATFTFKKLHKNGIHHLDYSRGNVLITRSSDGRCDFSIIDINRLRFEKVDYYKGLKNFSQIWASKEELTIIAREYASLNNKDSEEAVKLLIQFDKEHKTKIEKKLKWKARIKKKHILLLQC